jgi:hypothetical protein
VWIAAAGSVKLLAPAQVRVRVRVGVRVGVGVRVRVISSLILLF